MRLRPSRLPPVAPGSYPVALLGFVWRAPGLALACSGLLWPALPCSASVLVRPGPPCPVKPGSIVEQSLGDGGRGNETLPNETGTSSPAGRAQPILSWLGPVASGGSSSSQIRPHHVDESTVQCIGIVHQGLLASLPSLGCPSAMRQRPSGQ
ncbi:hypothetical protein EDB80DRAFT_704983 [Ilyonectria destructans]|nr:hypothetical protein EDB80DRAFT_704983 [Ilyonectria destructans]